MCRPYTILALALKKTELSKIPRGKKNHSLFPKLILKSYSHSILIKYCLASLINRYIVHLNFQNLLFWILMIPKSKGEQTYA